MGKLSNAKNLTKTEKYSIEGMYSNDMSTKEIAKALGRSESIVLKHVDTLQEEKEEPHESKGMAVMTEADSQRVDNLRENMPERPQHSAIHNIN
jgi:IS30 family transposase